MNVLVDTPLWSLLLRRTTVDLSPLELTLQGRLSEIIGEGRARIAGPVRQELLSGVRIESQFEKLKEFLRAFEDAEVGTMDYENAAQMSNRCRSRGIQGSPIDFLLCAIALRHNWELFTTDHDFIHFSRVLEIPLHRID